ncbi:MAG: response regulator [Candidatus Edwardsbacteria bacterium]
MEKAKILIVDDEPEIAELIKLDLLPVVTDGKIITAHSGEQALEIIYPPLSGRAGRQELPELIILDIMMPKIDGYQICRMLRNDTRTYHIPVIMLTAKKDLKEKFQGFEYGADDYITKPFEKLDLIARVRNQLRRPKKEIPKNPLTGLPGKLLIELKLQQISDNPEKKFGIIQLDLDNFKSFNLSYGFERGDEVLMFVASLLLEVVRAEGSVTDFIGHYGADDFLLITTSTKIEFLAEAIFSRFENEFPYPDFTLPSPKAFEEGLRERLPLTLSMAIVTNELAPLGNTEELKNLLGELMSKVKSHGRNNCLIYRGAPSSAG